jgi:hypothetical protein
MLVCKQSIHSGSLVTIEGVGCDAPATKSCEHLWPQWCCRSHEPRRTGGHVFHMHYLAPVKFECFQVFQELFWGQPLHARTGPGLAVRVQLAQHRISLGALQACILGGNVKQRSCIHSPSFPSDSTRCVSAFCVHKQMLVQLLLHLTLAIY